MTKLNNLIQEIKNCNGNDACFGRINDRIFPKVVYDECIDFSNCKVVVITERPLRNEDLIQKVKKKNFRARSTPYKLNDLFCGRFYDGILNGEIYWTHFIKCPVENGDSTRKMKDFVKNACAEKFLLRDIETLRPRLVIVFGSKARDFLLKKTKVGKNRDSLIKRQIGILNRMCRGEMKVHEILRELPEFKEVRVLFLYHPSGRNKLNLVNECFKEMLNRLLDEFLSLKRREY